MSEATAKELTLSEKLDALLQDPVTNLPLPDTGHGMHADSPIRRSQTSTKSRGMFAFMGLSNDQIQREFVVNGSFREKHFPEVSGLFQNKDGSLVTQSSNDGRYYLYDPGTQDPYKSTEDILEKSLSRASRGDIAADITRGQETAADTVEVLGGTADVVAEMTAGILAAKFAPKGSKGKAAAAAGTAAFVATQYAKLNMGAAEGLTESTLDEMTEAAGMDAALTVASYALMTPSLRKALGKKVDEFGKIPFVVERKEDFMRLMQPAMDAMSEAYNKASVVGKGAKEMLLSMSVGLENATRYLNRPQVRDRFKEMTRAQGGGVGRMGSGLAPADSIDTADKALFDAASEAVNSFQRGMSNYYGQRSKDIGAVAGNMAFNVSRYGRTLGQPLVDIGVVGRRAQGGTSQFNVLKPEEYLSLGQKPLAAVQQDLNKAFGENVTQDVAVKAQDFYTTLGREETFRDAFTAYTDAVAQAQNAGRLRGAEGFATFTELHKGVDEAARNLRNIAKELARKNKSARGASQFFDKFVADKVKVAGEDTVRFAGGIAPKGRIPGNLPRIGAANVDAATTQSMPGDVGKKTFLGGDAPFKSRGQQVLDGYMELQAEYRALKSHFSQMDETVKKVSQGKKSDFFREREVSKIVKELNTGKKHSFRQEEIMSALENPNAVDEATKRSMSEHLVHQAVERSKGYKPTGLGKNKTNSLHTFVNNMENARDIAAARAFIPVAQANKVTFLGSIGASVAFSDGESTGGEAMAASVGAGILLSSPRLFRNVLGMFKKVAADPNLSTQARHLIDTEFAKINEFVSNPSKMKYADNMSKQTKKELYTAIRRLKGAYAGMDAKAMQAYQSDDVAQLGFMRAVFEPVLESLEQDIVEGRRPDGKLNNSPTANAKVESLDSKPVKGKATGVFGKKKVEKQVNEPSAARKSILANEGSLADTRVYDDGSGVINDVGQRAMQDKIDRLAGKKSKGITTGPGGLNMLLKDVQGWVEGEQRAAGLTADWLQVAAGKQKLSKEQWTRIFDKKLQSVEKGLNKKLKGVSGLTDKQKTVLLDIEYNAPSLIGKNSMRLLRKGDVPGMMKEILVGMNKSKDPGNQGRRIEDAAKFGGSAENKRAALQKLNMVDRLRLKGIYRRASFGQKRRMRRAWPELVDVIKR